MARWFFRILAVTLILGGIVGGCGVIGQPCFDCISLDFFPRLSYQIGKCGKRYKLPWGEKLIVGIKPI